MRIVLPALLATVTVTVADVVVLPAASRATAVSVCEPLLAVVVSHETEYGAVVSSEPEVGAVEPELHADDADVVRRARRHRHRPDSPSPRSPAP